MATIRKTITLTYQQDRWVKSQVSNGSYTSESEYFSDLIRRDQEPLRRVSGLKLAIQKGLDSGESSRSVSDIWRAAEGRQALDSD